MSEKIQYKLYAMNLTPEALELAGTQRFSRVTKDYALIYTSDPIERDDAQEITDSETYRLTTEESKWLTDCNVLIITENTIENEAEFIKEVSGKLEQVEKALEEQQQKIAER